MKFSDLFVPRWQNSNPEVRKIAIHGMDDISLLSQIAEKDDDDLVRQAANSRIASLKEKYVKVEA